MEQALDRICLGARAVPLTLRERYGCMRKSPHLVTPVTLQRSLSRRISI
jgi:hypothetical protein